MCIFSLPYAGRIASPVLENSPCRAACVGKSLEGRLRAAAIVLPTTRAAIANFVDGVRQGDLLFLSSQGPVTVEGQRAGKVGRDVSAEEAYQHARLAGLNLSTQMRAILGSLDYVSRLVKVFGMVNAWTISQRIRP
jgi:enamine deaminase RidA (YjgF/YER057c/UK114 family)